MVSAGSGSVVQITLFIVILLFSAFSSVELSDKLISQVSSGEHMSLYSSCHLLKFPALCAFKICTA